MVDKIEFLGQLPIFNDLYDDELEELAQITDEYEFETGAAIAYQRDVADKFYIVQSGRLFARQVDKNGIVRDSRSYLPGDYFKDIWLFAPMTHEMTVNAATPGRVLVIEQKKFLSFLANNPGVLDALDLSEEARDEAERTQAALPGRTAKRLNLLTDEIVEYYERRTILLLFFQIIVPVIFALILTFLTVDLWTSDQHILAVSAGIFALIFFLVTLFLYVDWSNDYFMITNKHLVHNEYDLRHFQEKVNKVPIDQIQSVEILRPSLIQTLLNVGSARITTASRAGVLIFDFIDDPKAVEETINKLRQRVLAIDAGRVQAVMRASIEEHFEVPPAFEKVKDPDATPTAELKPQMSFIGRFLQSIAPRVENGSTITYRKHIFTVLIQTWWQILLGNLLLLGAVVTPTLWLAVLFAVMGVVDLAVFIWRFEDWRNDTFQVTDRYVIDIDRQPFGFGESRKQAELGNVQNVSAERPGFLYTVLNFGYVHIETAGASADITFEQVANPSRVQSDIFQRREQFSQGQRIREGQNRRKEYAVFMDAFQQAVEQNRLPERRTPSLDDLDDLDDLPEEDEIL
ncbi:MAG: cyclic nucleotide-binding domain-containing protein [Candidatus Promineifilaceae bacterium]